MWVFQKTSGYFERKRHLLPLKGKVSRLTAKFMLGKNSRQ
jgi:hypothetical protein